MLIDDDKTHELFCFVLFFFVCLQYSAAFTVARSGRPLISRVVRWCEVGMYSHVGQFRLDFGTHRIVCIMKTLSNKKTNK